MKKILFVCTGNTCRSPMAEITLKSKIKAAGLTDISVSSAGLSVPEGSKITLSARKALNKAGLKASGFKSRQLTRKILDKSDIVLCMTAAHKNALKGFERVYTLKEAVGVEDISDPYGLGDKEYEKTLREIEIACEEIIKNILKVKGENVK